MSEEGNQKIGDITGSKRVEVTQEQSGGKPLSQSLGNISQSEDVKIRQAALAVESMTDAEQYIAPLAEGLREYNEHILPNLALLVENHQQLQEELRELAEKLSKPELNPKTKLKLAIPLIPKLLTIETEYNLSEKLRQGKERVTEQTARLYRGMVETLTGLKERLGL